MPRPRGIGPEFDQNHLRAEFTALSRAPFVEILADVMGCAPTQKAMEIFANESPDKWSKMVETFARLSGYSDKVEINKNIHMTIQALGDTDLVEEIARIEGEIVQLRADEWDILDDTKEGNLEPVYTYNNKGEIDNRNDPVSTGQEKSPTAFTVGDSLGEDETN